VRDQGTRKPQRGPGALVRRAARTVFAPPPESCHRDGAGDRGTESARHGHARGQQLGISDDELAFYHALETNDGPDKGLGDDTLKLIAWELVATVRKYCLPPDKRDKATQIALEQAELFSGERAVA